VRERGKEREREKRRESEKERETDSLAGVSLMPFSDATKRRRS